jgi:hypothetical protein
VPCFVAGGSRDVTSLRFPITVCEFEEKSVGTTDFEEISSRRVLQQRAYSSAEILLERRFVLKVIQVLISEKIIALVQLLKIGGRELCICKHETAERALENSGVQDVIARIVSAEDAQWSNRRSVRDWVIVGCQCSGCL